MPAGTMKRLCEFIGECQLSEGKPSVDILQDSKNSSRPFKQISFRETVCMQGTVDTPCVSEMKACVCVWQAGAPSSGKESKVEFLFSRPVAGRLTACQKVANQAQLTAAAYLNRRS